MRARCACARPLYRIYALLRETGLRVQTIRRPEQYYSHMASAETPRLCEAGANGAIDGVVDAGAFPVGALDVFNCQLDLRTAHTWTMFLPDVSTLELAEVFTINSMAPFIMCSKLKAALAAEPSRPSFIINVSSMEGAEEVFAGASCRVTQKHTLCVCGR